MKAKKKSNPTPEQRRLQTQRVIFSIISILVILSWVIALIAK
jgi:hypothetical protein